MGIVANSDESQELLQPSHEAAIRRYFQRRVPAHDVDDMVQDVLLSIRQRREGSEIENVEAYLFTVAAHALSRYRRKAAQFRDDDGALAHLDLVEDPAATPERILLGREEIALVVRTLERLPARTREIFMMHRFSAMTYSALARHHGISPSAIEKHMTNALRALMAATERAR